MKCDSDISMESNSTDHHSSDVEGLRGVHLTQLPEGFSPASSTHALLILTLSVLDQTSTNCKDGHKKINMLHNRYILMLYVMFV